MRETDEGEKSKNGEGGEECLTLVNKEKEQNVCARRNGEHMSAGV